MEVIDLPLPGIGLDWTKPKQIKGCHFSVACWKLIHKVESLIQINCSNIKFNSEREGKHKGKNMSHYSHSHHRFICQTTYTSVDTVCLRFGLLSFALLTINPSFRIHPVVSNICISFSPTTLSLKLLTASRCINRSKWNISNEATERHSARQWSHSQLFIFPLIDSCGS